MVDSNLHQGSRNKDTLFQSDLYPKSSFVFDTRVAEVFDDMLQRSIPHYREVMKISCDFLLTQGPGGMVYDLGSSTGNFLLGLAAQDLCGKYREYLGIDNSPAMVEKAEKKYSEVKITLPGDVKVDFVCENILTYNYRECGGMTLHYTLQFIPPDRRYPFLKRLYHALLPGGLLVLSEKIEEVGPQIGKWFTDRYHHFKADNSYTAAEIARKKEALEKVLIPFTPDDYQDIFRQIGFREIAVAFKWYNFITWFMVK